MIGPARAAALALALVVIAGPASGQAQDDSAAPPRYQVEVIVFTQPPIGESVEEAPGTEPIPLPDRLAWPLGGSDDGLLGYDRLPVSSYQLTDTARRIDARPGFDVHWHAAWNQPGVSRSTAQPLALPAIESIPALDGTIQISRERFRHARVELRLAESADTHWTLSASRRLRGEQPHYFDHPVLGVVIRVDPLGED
ncbi:CsiV family protein [Spiribacter vilamensis]|uniref:Peptidoglycan-binding protein CsiV n=1 Tax=Spiribacter vilamensis TaxID=531306 RepID=A0A4Q8CZX7_9GAMM|nr:CsiV family protein [Spiribacter vilamensis]RZU98507.1 peptidoglycan-binding protein CsiV [Spiribacter vilamensis]TVO60628.1 hypothetical protein FPL09_00155 [Spiribacter vilamensis]